LRCSDRNKEDTPKPKKRSPQFSAPQAPTIQPHHLPPNTEARVPGFQGRSRKRCQAPVRSWVGSAYKRGQQWSGTREGEPQPKGRRGAGSRLICVGARGKSSRPNPRYRGCRSVCGARQPPASGIQENFPSCENPFFHPPPKPHTVGERAVRYRSTYSQYKRQRVEFNLNL